MDTQNTTPSTVNRREFVVGSLAAGASLAVGGGIAQGAAMGKPVAPFVLEPLPYADDALEPIITAHTLSFHYDKHHRAYLDNMNRMVEGTAYARMTLENIVLASAKKGETGLFNNAAQTWNHTFYWHSLKPGGSAIPDRLKRKLEADFGSVDACKKALAEASITQFASGWGWLVADRGTLKVVKTSNAEVPLTEGMTPLLTIDVWEHAYYLDHQNRRAEYVNAVIDKLLNWQFAADNLYGKK